MEKNKLMGNYCPNTDKYCDVALRLEEMCGKINGQLSAGEQIMKSQKASLDTFCDRIEKVLDRQDQRIRAVESKVWYASGGVSVITAAITAGIVKLFGGGHG